MSPVSSPSLKEIAVGDLTQEIDTARRMLERVPEQHFAWKPHEKSMTLGALASHLANLLYWQTAILTQEELDLATVPSRGTEATSREELLRTFDEKAEALREALDQTEEADLERPWTLRRGEDVMFTRPKGGVLRRMGISHMIHHRAQLGVYLRLLEVPVPPSYGPTADESGT